MGAARRVIFILPLRAAPASPTGTEAEEEEEEEKTSVAACSKAGCRIGDKRFDWAAAPAPEASCANASSNAATEGSEEETVACASASRTVARAARLDSTSRLMASSSTSKRKNRFIVF